MKLSILIAVHNAQNNLPILINELLEQDDKRKDINNEIEIVLSIDDDFCYEKILVKDKRIKYAEKGINTGPAIARNRALKESIGNYITLLDSDDFISSNYVSSIFKNLNLYNAFALRTVYKKDNLVIRKLEDNYLDYNNFSDFLGSVHTVCPKTYIKKYLNYLAEDVIATLTVLAKKNGRIPIIEAEYINNINENSYCSKNVNKFYENYSNIIKNSYSISKELKEDKLNMLIKKVFNERLEADKNFIIELEKNKKINYHDFVLKRKNNKSNIFGRWY